MNLRIALLSALLALSTACGLGGSSGGTSGGLVTPISCSDTWKQSKYQSLWDTQTGPSSDCSMIDGKWSKNEKGRLVVYYCRGQVGTLPNGSPKTDFQYFEMYTFPDGITMVANGGGRFYGASGPSVPDCAKNNSPIAAIVQSEGYNLADPTICKVDYKKNFCAP